MKKIVTIIIIAIFICIGIRYSVEVGSRESKEILAEAFSQTEFEEIQTTILFEDEYIGEYLSRENAKEVLKELANTMGIFDDYEIQEEKKEDLGNVLLVKEGKNASTHLEIITYENSNIDNELWTKQYLKVELIVYDNVKQALVWKEKLEDILGKYIDDSNGKISISGAYSGKLTVDEKNSITNKLMQDTDTEEVIFQKSEDMYIIYGLSDVIDIYREIDGAKINLSISMDYDETKNKTMLMLSSPI